MGDSRHGLEAGFSSEFSRPSKITKGGNTFYKIPQTAEIPNVHHYIASPFRFKGIYGMKKGPFLYLSKTSSKYTRSDAFIKNMEKKMIEASFCPFITFLQTLLCRIHGAVGRDGEFSQAHLCLPLMSHCKPNGS